MKRIKRNKLQGRFTVLTGIIFVVLCLYVISMLAPMFWAFITSFKDKWDFRTNKIGLPAKWVLDNYIVAFKSFKVRIFIDDVGYKSVYMGEMYLYSLLYAGGCALTATLVPCITGYLTARFDYKFSRIVNYTVIITMVLPIIGSLPSQIQMAMNLGIYNKIFCLWIMTGNIGSTYFLIFQAGFRSLPTSYFEAAEIDGASNFNVMIRIGFPLIRSTFLTIMLIHFIAFWNDYQTPLVFMKNYPTVALGIYMFNFTSESELSSVPMRITGAMLLLVPIVIFFFVFQNKIFSQISFGGIKE